MATTTTATTATTTTTFESLPLDHFKGSEDPCPICFEPTSGAVLSTPCGHVFHVGCLNTWFEQQDQDCRDCSCPYCREVVFAAHVVEDEEWEGASELLQSGEEIENVMLAAWWNFHLYEDILESDTDSAPLEAEDDMSESVSAQ
ncbi:hypothetical protein NX059_010270 [Plenodomus lindquistii]|nr:hypothetical protein NX059_010270 [Plenodomus lindquistii]